MAPDGSATRSGVGGDVPSGSSEANGPEPRGGLVDPGFALPALERLHASLADRATERSRAFWTGYVKGAPPFLGVPMGSIRTAVAAWWREESIASRSLEDRKALAVAAFDGAFAEHRLAGVLMLAEHLIDDLDAADLPAFAGLFARERIADWNLCDWFCIKVLAAMIRADAQPPGLARAVVDWRHAESLWQRRAACVAFVPLASDGGAHVPELPDLVVTACEALVRDPARFAQTGVGWTLRELARARPGTVVDFVERNLDRLSLEAVRSLAKGLDDGARERLVAAKKAERGGGAS